MTTPSDADLRELIAAHREQERRFLAASKLMQAQDNIDLALEKADKARDTADALTELQSLRAAMRSAIAELEAIGPAPTHDTYGDRRRLMLGVAKALHHLRAIPSTLPTEGTHHD
jgi:hypothetical protein